MTRAWDADPRRDGGHIPERDTLRRVRFQLKYPGAHVTPPWYGTTGQWTLRYQPLSLQAPTLTELMDDAEEWETLTGAADRLPRRAWLRPPARSRPQDQLPRRVPGAQRPA